LALPRVIGHRGAAAYAPENTLAGFRAARALGCAWIEFDVRLTADQHPVVCHDDQLSRTTDGRGRISKLTLADIRAFDAGEPFGAGFAGEPVPTLEETLLLCHEIGLGANVEIKAEGGRGPATAEAVAQCLDRLAGNLPPLLISSFLSSAIARIAELAPTVPRGMLWRKIPANWAATAAQLGCTTIHCSQAELTPKTVADVIAAGYPLLAYTVNDTGQARQLFNWGVASVFSDAPDIIGKAAAHEGAGALGRACL
jgi:glycerophosphoryl diester phosphodiesterase